MSCRTFHISVFLPGKSHGQRILAGYSPWDCKRFQPDLVTNVYTHICKMCVCVYMYIYIYIYIS